MTSPSKRLSARRQQVENALKRNQEELQRLKLIEQHLPAEDLFDNHTVLRFTRLLGGKRYNYVALKANSRWYLTGSGNQVLTWLELCDFLAIDTDMKSIKVAEKWTPIEHWV